MFKLKKIVASGLIVTSLVIFIASSFAGPAGKKGTDWPQWRGPNRDGVSLETGLLKSWPEEGPEVIWEAPAGDGFSGISISDGRLYTMYGKNAFEYLVCLNAEKGEELWRLKVDGKFTNQFGHGTRSTPTVDGNSVYGLSAQGKLVAVKTKNGELIWKHDLQKEYGAQIPQWGISTSPLVYNELLIVDVGGRDYGLVAFNKKNGKVVWKTKTDKPGYSAPIAVNVNGKKQILNFSGSALISVSPKDGSRYWRYPWVTDYDINAATPIFVGPDKVFISSGYNRGGALLKMTPESGSVNVSEVWKSRAMRNHFSTSLLVDNHLYGFDEKTLKCINVNTQEEKWAQRGFGKGSLITADGHLIVLSDKGILALIEANPSAYVEKATAQVLKGKCWTVPTLSDAKLYVRNEKQILCLDITETSASATK